MTINQDGTFNKYYPVLEKNEKGDLIQDWISKQLNNGQPKNNSKLDRITIIDKNGNHVRTVVKENDLWRVE